MKDGALAAVQAAISKVIDLDSISGVADVAPVIQATVNESPHLARLGRGVPHETNPTHTRADHPQTENA